jgi:membrane protein implicated in regulation of membrane protease activity
MKSLAIILCGLFVGWAIAMLGVYIVGEYTAGAFVKKFWWMYVVLIVLGVASAWLGRRYLNAQN